MTNVPASRPPPPQPDAASGSQPPRYHHGDLRNALIGAALDLAREGGPQAIVLREAARRVGVSPTAAYRHFTALPHLLEAVMAAALSALAGSMEDELTHVVPAADPQELAWRRMCAIGRGYVHFAVREPGLFATAFDRKKGMGHADGGAGPSGLTAAELLERSLDELVDVRLLAPADRAAAATHAWAVVHGLSLLLLGPLHEVPTAEREDLIESSLDLVGRGLVIRDAPVPDVILDPASEGSPGRGSVAVPQPRD